MISDSIHMMNVHGNERRCMWFNNSNAVIHQTVWKECSTHVMCVAIQNCARGYGKYVSKYGSRHPDKLIHTHTHSYTHKQKSSTERITLFFQFCWCSNGSAVVYVDMSFSFNHRRIASPHNGRKKCMKSARGKTSSMNLTVIGSSRLLTGQISILRWCTCNVYDGSSVCAWFFLV